MLLRLLVGGVAVVAAALTAGLATGRTAPQPEPQRYTSGAYLYQTFCASCHGDSGRGDGAVASLLKVRPSDLTAISARHGGSFPRVRVLAVIDGRTPVPGHGRSEMPVWGDVLRITEGQDERTVAARIAALADHLESWQRPRAEQ